MANEVVLTFAGDEDRLTRSMERVGQAGDKMADKIDKSSKSIEESGKGFDDAAEGFDRAEQRAMGFRDTVTGVQDSVTGFGKVLKGDFSADALLTAGAGIGDLASGFSNLLVPALGKAVTWFASTKVGMLAAEGATKLVTAGQWLLNAAMSANPIGLVVIGITALIAVFVLLWNKCDWFRNFWIGLWDGIKLAAGKVVDWLGNTPTLLKNAFSGLFDILVWPYKTAFNFIADAWNGTIGKLHWTIPDWVPVIGGKEISAPKLPHFHSGIDRVPGVPGAEVLAVLQAGERVQTRAQADAADARGGTTIFNVMISLDDLAKIKTIQDFFEMLRNKSRQGLGATA